MQRRPAKVCQTGSAPNTLRRQRRREPVEPEPEPVHLGLHEVRLCRYVVRPPFALHRLSAGEHGRLVYRMKRPRGSSLFLVLTPDELLARQATLVPPPRVHGVRYHGVFTPNAPAARNARRCEIPQPCRGSPDRAARPRVPRSARGPRLEARPGRRDRFAHRLKARQAGRAVRPFPGPPAPGRPRGPPAPPRAPARRPPPSRRSRSAWSGTCPGRRGP